MEDLFQQILVDENNSTVLPKDKNANLANVPRARPNICTTERYIQTQQQLKKTKVVPGNNKYSGTLRKF